MDLARSHRTVGLPEDVENARLKLPAFQSRSLHPHNRTVGGSLRSLARSGEGAVLSSRTRADTNAKVYGIKLDERKVPVESGLAKASLELVMVQVELDTVVHSLRGQQD